MGEFFPELIDREKLIKKTLKSEEESFNKTLDRGIELFSRETKDSRQGEELSGKFAFKLYDTYGFPLDLTELMAREHGLSVNLSEFNDEMEAQKARAREAHKSVDILVSDNDTSINSTEFCGYRSSNLENFSSTCIDVIDSNDKSFLVFDKSPFYAEMGGQVGDTGEITIADSTIKVVDVIKDTNDRFLHEIKKPAAEFEYSGSPAVMTVNLERRIAIQRHHTATHVLHWALREVLGDHIKQAGSLVEEDRLRFDFSHFEAVSAEQLRTIERLANEKLLLNENVEIYEIPFTEKPEGVIAFFGDKYGEFVRVVDIGGWSQELCGGTHVSATGEIGFIRIISESAISAGVRRLEAMAGLAAYKWSSERVDQYNQLLKRMACQPDELSGRIDQLQEKAKELEKQLRSHQQKGLAGMADDLLKSARELNGIKIITGKVSNLAANDLRALTAQVNKRSEPSVVLLASEAGNKCAMVCICSEAAVEAGHKAGTYLNELAQKIGGKGGGKPDFAMGGGPSGKGVDGSYRTLPELLIQ